MLKTVIDSFKSFLTRPTTGQVRQVDPAQIRKWWDAGQVLIVDVREPDEHDHEAIRGAMNLPLSRFDPALVPHPAPGQHLVLHCMKGIRCAPASDHLVASGWQGEIVRMKGGLIGWIAAGGPTTLRH